MNAAQSLRNGMQDIEANLRKEISHGFPGLYF